MQTSLCYNFTQIHYLEICGTGVSKVVFPLYVCMYVCVYMYVSEREREYLHVCLLVNHLFHLSS